MKILLIIAIVLLASCSNKADQTEVYQDSAIYYSNRMAAIADAGYSLNEYERIQQKTEYTICSTMRQYYIDKTKTR
jgi:hypothetical protein